MTSLDEEHHFGLEQRRETVLFADIVDSVLEMNRFERSAVARVRSFKKLAIDDIAPKFGGRVIRSSGDDVLVTFDEAVNAVAAAGDLLERKRAIEDESGRRLPIRIGIGTGDVFHIEGDIAGDAVNRAARLMQLAKPDEIFIDVATRDRIAGAIDVDITDLGEAWVRNMPSSVRSFRVGPARSDSAMTKPASSVAPHPRVAVLPLATMADAGAEKLGEIIASELTLHLSRSNVLKVVSRLSAASVSRWELTAEQVCARLNAEYLISGTCQCYDGRASITLELAAASDCEAIAVERVAANTEELFEIGNPLMGELASRIYAAIVSAELRAASHAPPSSLKAYTALLGAVTLLHRLGRKDFERARDLLEGLVHRDPRSAMGHAWLAFWHAMLVHQGWSENFKRDAYLAEEASSRALELEPENAFALTVDGSVNVNLIHRPDIGEGRYDDAIAASPSEALARILRSALYAFTDRGDEAIADAEAAIGLAPFDPNRFMFDAIAASAHLTAEGFEDALAFADRSLAANRRHGSALRVKMVSAWRLGQVELARDTCRELMRLEPTLTVESYAARAANAGSRIGGEIARAMREIGVPDT